MSGMALRYALGTCSLGALLVASSERGLCAVLLGEDPQALVRDLAERFPRSRCAPGGGEDAARLEAVVAWMERPGADLELPLDARGTAFQQRVWEALREIPAGATETYTALATRLGLPRSVRAVAQACGANPLAVVVPCHRVVRADGGLAGYRWGLERKRALLQREATRRALKSI